MLKLRSLPLAAWLALGCALPVAGLPNNLSVLIDGAPVTFDQPPISQGGRVLVPLRGIFERLGAEVKYDGATRHIRASKLQTVVELTLGSQYAVINGRSITLDTPANTIGGRTVVPLRFVSEALGAEVKWMPASRTIQISSGGVVPERPRILQVYQDANHALSAGEAVTVTMNGDPGGRAWFEIPGAVERVPMTPTPDDGYRGSWVVPKGLSLPHGQVVVHLEIRGQESKLEAPGQVSIHAAVAAAPNFYPAIQATVTMARPRIGITYPERVRPETMRLRVDDQDVSQWLERNDTGQQWTPPTDLPDGVHRVVAEVTAVNGQPLSYQWTFDVASGREIIREVEFAPPGPFVGGQTFRIIVKGAQHASCSIDIGGRTGLALSETTPGTYEATYTVANSDHGDFPIIGHMRLPDGRQDTHRSARPVVLNNGGGASGFFLRLSTPANGQLVGPSFEVKGQTFPYAHLQLQVTSQQSLVPGVLSLPGVGAQASGSANSQGFFDVFVGVPNTGSGARLSVSVRAFDDQGHALPPALVQVIRQ